MLSQGLVRVSKEVHQKLGGSTARTVTQTGQRDILCIMPGLYELGELPGGEANGSLGTIWHLLAHAD